MTNWHTTDQDLASLAAALAHPARVRLLRLLLRKGPTTVGDLVREMPVAQATVSQHLAALAAADLVVARRDGRATRYEVAAPALRRLSSLVASLAMAAASPRPTET